MEKNPKMHYRKFGNTGCEISALGFGTMRFPKLDDDTADEVEAIKMLRYAIDRGVNYIDTAYFYHNGESEKIVGKALLDGYRDKVYIATKMPVFKMTCEEDFDKILDEQLTKLQTDHIDFYLLHALNNDSWDKKVLPFNVLEKIKKARAAGKIRHLGFSFHDDEWVFRKIVDGFDEWEFCQIEYNYIDTDYQAGAEGLQYAADKGLGVIVMEPLKGGMLANPPQAVVDILGNEKSPVEWALDFLWSLPQVSFLLSGMSTMEQVKANLEFAANSSIGKYGEKEFDILKKAKQAIDNLSIVPCTGCRYCMPCPQEVKIPVIFSAWNTLKNGNNRRDVKNILPDIEEQISKCVKCGRCVEKCPQQINIPEALKKISHKF